MDSPHPTPRRATLPALAVTLLTLASLGAPATAQLTQATYLKATNTDALDGFGSATALDGDTLVVGAPFEASASSGVSGNQSNDAAAGAGAVYVYRRFGAGWVMEAYLKASNTDSGDNFGHDVALSGDTLVVGAPHEASAATGVNGNQADDSAPNTGAAYVFRRKNGVWSQQAYLKASNAEADDRFGIRVAIDGDTLIVAADGEDSGSNLVNGDQAQNTNPNAGAAYVFERNAGVWAQTAYLKAPNSSSGDFFGFSLALHGDWAAVGAPLEDSGATGIDGDGSDNSAPASGAVYTFRRSFGLWSLNAYLKASNTGSSDEFGRSLALFEETLAVGAPLESGPSTGVGGPEGDGTTFSGAVYVFVYGGGNQWSQEAYVKASNTENGDRFGSTVAVESNALVVGAPEEDSASTGPGGDQANNFASKSGAAYVFERGGNGWAQTDYLKASNTDAGDEFGGAVTVSAGRVVVGASLEDSAALSSNGDAADDSAASAGAVYDFHVPVNCGTSSYGPGTGANIGTLSTTTGAFAGQGMVLEITNVFGSGTALLALSAAPASIPGFGGTLLVDPFQSILGPGNFLPVPVVNGYGQIVIPLPPGTSGLTFYGQAAKFDLNQPGWLDLTNGLQATICP